MSIIVVIGVILLLILMFGKKEITLMRIVLGVVELALLIVCLLAFTRHDDLFLKVPFTRIDSTSGVEVSNTGTFYLESSQSALVENKFYLSGENSDEMRTWLADTKKNVYIYISDGNKTLYSKNLGTYKDGMEDTIIDVYSSWKADGVIPGDASRYWFLVFYLEV